MTATDRRPRLAPPALTALGFALIVATAAQAEPDKPKPKPDQAMVAQSQGQAEMANSAQTNSQGGAALIGPLHGANVTTVAVKAKKVTDVSKAGVPAEALKAK